MDFDDFFDDDIDIEEIALASAFLGMVEEEDELERKRRKLEEELPSESGGEDWEGPEFESK